MSASELLAEVWRGEVAEVALRGHVAAVDGDGRLVAAAGDPDTVTTLRSVVKPFQAIPFVATGAFERLGCGEDELALACGSHDGEPVHVATARRLLARAGLDDAALRCGPQVPYSAAAAAELVRAGEAAGRIHNNCSGKHAAMLATCVVEGWPLDGYLAPDHPLQRQVAAALGAAAGVDLERAPRGIDGCGLTTYGLPLRALARAFAAGPGAAAFRRCQAAMAAQPCMVGGERRFDSVLLAAAGARLTAKSGGAAVWAAATRAGGLGVAVKLEGGGAEHLGPVALAVLAALDLLDADPGPALAAFREPPLRNWAGTVVGTTRAVLRLRRA